MLLTNPLLAGLIAVLALMFVLWLASIPLKNVAIVDLFWGPAVVLTGVVYWFSAAAPSARATLITGLALLWAVRLGIYLYLRNSGKSEDRRYRDMRARHDPGFKYKSLFIVFWLQAVLAWVIGWPLYGAIFSDNALGLLDFLGVAIFLFGLVWETIADWQLARFLESRGNSGAVMDKGLWRYSRHPNYFGEFCLWWGLWLLAASAGAYWTVIGPALLSYFLLKVSGVALLEKDISERRPAYRAYIDKTSAFFPRKPAAD
jgi:steroid 5-alpha reductase family enzyme